MPRLNMEFSHRLTEEDALKRVKALLPKVKEEFSGDIKDLREEWKGNTGRFSFRAKGFSVTGTLAVKGQKVELVANLPIAAFPVKGKIESNIRERAKALLA